MQNNQPVAAFASRRSSNDSSVYRVPSTKMSSKLKVKQMIFWNKLILMFISN